MAMTTLARRSPPTERVVAVLDFLVARQGERFGLSELARNLGLAKPTCLGIVTALTAGGYLVRDPVTKTYGLGPALIAAGRVARTDFAVGAVARRRLAGLSARYDTVCTASAWHTGWPGRRRCRCDRTARTCGGSWPSAGSAGTWWRASPRWACGCTR